MGGDGTRKNIYMINDMLKSTPPAWAGTVSRHGYGALYIA